MFAENLQNISCVYGPTQLNCHLLLLQNRCIYHGWFEFGSELTKMTVEGQTQEPSAWDLAQE